MWKVFAVIFLFFCMLIYNYTYPTEISNSTHSNIKTLSDISVVVIVIIMLVFVVLVFCTKSKN